eukprot:6472544-Amphidinium_carterae.1
MAVFNLCPSPGLGVDRGVALNAYRRCNQSEEEAANCGDERELMFNECWHPGLKNRSSKDALRHI